THGAETKLLSGHRRAARQRAGNAGPQSTSQRQGTLANPSTSQAGPVVHLHRILSVPTVPFAAHALADLMSTNEIQVNRRRISRASIRVHDVGHPASVDRHFQRISGELAAQRAAHPPP